jgi:hypothetical protein
MREIERTEHNRIDPRHLYDVVRRLECFRGFQKEPDRCLLVARNREVGPFPNLMPGSSRTRTRAARSSIGVPCEFCGRNNASSFFRTLHIRNDHPHRSCVQNTHYEAGRLIRNTLASLALCPKKAGAHTRERSRASSISSSPDRVGSGSRRKNGSQTLSSAFSGSVVPPREHFTEGHSRGMQNMVTQTTAHHGRPRLAGTRSGEAPASLIRQPASALRRVADSVAPNQRFRPSCSAFPGGTERRDRHGRNPRSGAASRLRRCSARAPRDAWHR